MPTSGAAANPRSGVGGTGVTRNQVVSLVMTLLNFRLGYWMRRPQDPTSLEARIGQKRPNHFYPSGLYSITKRGYRENSDFIELSDGGHFENLALYELVRRRCSLIIVCDGGQDLEASHSDFVTAIRRIEQDFAATLHLDMEIDGVESGPKDLISRPSDELYPKNAEYATKGFFVATIDYNWRAGCRSTHGTRSLNTVLSVTRIARASSSTSKPPRCASESEGKSMWSRR